MAKLGRDDGKRRTGRTRGRPSPDAAAQIDREILSAARQVFFEHGYERTSMAMIIKAAHVSKTTLYARYATKEDLFTATVQLTIDLIQIRQLAPEQQIEHDLVSGLITYARDVIVMAISPLWANYERMVYAEGTRLPELSRLIAERFDLNVRKVANFVTECAERDGMTCRDPEAVGTVLITAIRGFCTVVVLRGEQPDAEACEAFARKLVNVLIMSREDW